MKLTTKAIEALAHLRAVKKATELKETELTQSFRDELQLREIDEFAPRASVLKVVLNEYDRSEVKWKAVAEELAKALYATDWKSGLEKKVKECGKKCVAAVLLKPNENYRVAQNGNHFKRKFRL